MFYLKYRLLFIILIIAWISLPSLADSVVKSGAEKALLELKVRSETPVHTQWHKDRGTIHSLYNLSVPLPAGMPEVSARQFLNDHRALFGMTDPNISLHLKSIQRSLTGEHVRFTQYYNGVEVYGGVVSVHFNRSGQIRVVQSSYFPGVSIQATAAFSPEEAISIAILDANARHLCKQSNADLVIFPDNKMLNAGNYAKAYRLAYRAIIHSQEPIATWEYIINANTRQILYRRNLLWFSEGRGRVFNPNPVVVLKDRTLEDMNDSNSAIPESAYSDVRLSRLDGSGYLDGTYVSTRLTKNGAFEPSLNFNYHRRDDRFEEVMTYYHIDSIANYLAKLGFDDWMQDWQIPVDAHVGDIKTAFYDPIDMSLHFGDKNADAAEDGEVIIHEYGHAILDRQVYDFGQSSEARAICEGFSDILAASYFLPVSGGFGDTMIAEWGLGGAGKDRGIGIRTVNGVKHYPEDISGEEYDDGEIWSACLWQLLSAMGRDAAIQLIVESQFYLDPDSTFIDGVLAIYLADMELNNEANSDLIMLVFIDRGILSEPLLKPDAFEDNDTFAKAKKVTLPFLPENSGALSIDLAEDDDYYKFDLRDAADIHISISYHPFNGYDNAKLGLVLLDSRGIVINNSTFEIKGSFLNKQIITTGALKLKAGSYIVAVLDEALVPVEYELLIAADKYELFVSAMDAGIGEVGGYGTGFIDYPGDVDEFIFEAKKGQRLDIIVERRDRDSKTDTFLKLYNKDNVLLGKNDDVDFQNPRRDPRSSSWISSYVIPSSGSYWVVINDVDDLVGGVEYGYKLTIVEDDERKTLIEFDEAVSGAINYPGDNDNFYFDAKAGQIISLQAKAVDTDSLVDGSLYLWSPDNEIVAQFGTDSKEQINPYIDGYRIPYSGIYGVTVSYDIAPEAKNKKYTLKLTESLDDYPEYSKGKETELAFDEQITGSISFVGDKDAFSFKGSRGQVIKLEVMAERAGSPLDAILDLLNTNGKMIISVDDYGDSTDPVLPGFMLPEDGMYHVQVSAYKGGDSSYTYSLTISQGKIPEDDYGNDLKSATRISINKPVKGVINYPNDVDTFVFKASRDDSISIEVDASVSKSPLDSFLSLYDSKKELKWSDNFDDAPDPRIQDFLIPADGDYYVSVSGANAKGGAEYTYSLLITKGYPAWDVNRDGKVDVFDLVIVGKHFGESVLPAAPDAALGEPRSVSSEGKLSLLMAPSVTNTRRLTVSISITPIADLYGYQFSIGYDPEVLELISSSPSRVLAGDLSQSHWSASVEHASMSAICLTQVRQGTPYGVKAEGMLVSLVFNVRKSQAQYLPINITTAQFADSQARAIPVGIINEPIAFLELFPEKSELLQNYPNPFNPETWIPYQLSEDSDVKIKIYDVKGELVRQIDLGNQHAGKYATRGKAAYLDGRNEYGERAVSGVYFYHIQAGSFNATRKMIIVR